MKGLRGLATQPAPSALGSLREGWGGGRGRYLGNFREALGGGGEHCREPWVLCPLETPPGP